MWFVIVLTNIFILAGKASFMIAFLKHVMQSVVRRYFHKFLSAVLYYFVFIIALYLILFTNNT